MQSFDTIWHLRNGKQNNSLKISERSSTEISPIVNASERNFEDESEVHVLTQEVNDSIRKHIGRWPNN